MLKAITRGAAAGAAAGAAGTTVLNAVTHADTSIRGRPSGDAPAQVERAARRTGVAVPGEDQTRGSQLSGLGPFSGTGTGVAAGAACGVARALGWRPTVPSSAHLTAAIAMAGADGPLFALGVSDPCEWSAADSASDVVPHGASEWSRRSLWSPSAAVRAAAAAAARACGDWQRRWRTEPDCGAARAR
jgi:hypothetical protein